MSNTNENNKMYMHDSQKAMQAALIRWEAAAYETKDEDVITLIDGGTISGEDATARAIKANRTIFFSMVKGIGNEDLLGILGGPEYKGKGIESMQYIKNYFAPKGGKSKQALANRYDEIKMMKGIPISKQEFSKIRTEMAHIQSALHDHQLAITDGRLAADLITIVSNISTNMELHVKTALLEMEDKDHRDEPSKVGPMLEDLLGDVVTPTPTMTSKPIGAATTSSGSNEMELMIQMMAAVKDMPSHHQNEAMELLRVMAANMSRDKNDRDRGGGRPSRCPACDVIHPGGTKMCFAVMCSKGQTPPNWDKMPAESKKRTEQRGELIKQHGWFKDGKWPADVPQTTSPSRRLPSTSSGTNIMLLWSQVGTLAVTMATVPARRRTLTPQRMMMMMVEVMTIMMMMMMMMIASYYFLDNLLPMLLRLTRTRTRRMTMTGGKKTLKNGHRHPRVPQHLHLTTRHHHRLHLRNDLKILHRAASGRK